MSDTVPTRKATRPNKLFAPRPDRSQPQLAVLHRTDPKEMSHRTIAAWSRVTGRSKSDYGQVLVEVKLEELFGPDPPTKRLPLTKPRSPTMLKEEAMPPVRPAPLVQRPITRPPPPKKRERDTAKLEGSMIPPSPPAPLATPPPSKAKIMEHMVIEPGEKEFKIAKFRPRQRMAPTIPLVAPTPPPPTPIPPFSPEPTEPEAAVSEKNYLRQETVRLPGGKKY